LIEKEEGLLSVRQQCELLEMNRSGLYYEPCPVSEEDLMLMNLIDEQYTKTPFYGSRKIGVYLKHLGHEVNRKHIQRLMRKMGIAGVCPGPNTSKRNQAHKVYPYLLKGLKIIRSNQVWSTDITYIKLQHGFVYLVAVIDWYSRYILSWRLSNSLETSFCLEALEESLKQGRPDIFNTDQGVQFTSDNFTNVLKNQEIKISMDSKGRALDNIFVERFWRSLKYEDIYLKNYETVNQAYAGIKKYIYFYNQERFHQSLNYRTPQCVYLEK
jgi:putative transposase